ncbi:MAG TPA: hypothetical protein VJP39_04660 [Gaiellaceae bacterium]|nr:hypothetical protein [Gaiellaceae bacterium]
MAALRALTAAALVALVCASAGSSATASVSFTPLPGHRIVAFAADRLWLVLAEDPTTTGGCPEVVLFPSGGGRSRVLTASDGATCRFGGHFWVRQGTRAIGNAIVKALWVVRNGSSAIAVKASPTEREVVLARISNIEPDVGPFLGPVVATNWLRLFGDYTRAGDGTLSGGVISGNKRTLWQATGAVLPLGLDDTEHAVSVGADGSISMWHAHGARYGNVANASARAAAMVDGTVLVMRSDAPRIDVRVLGGNLVSSWHIAADALPFLDADTGTAVYFTPTAVHELDYASGHDTVVAGAPRGTSLIDAQIEKTYVVYAYRGANDPRGTVVVTAR